MADIYVGGPVLGGQRPIPAAWISGTYNAAQQVIQGAGFAVTLPISEPFLEHAEPPIFYSQIAGRIQRSEAAIILFTPGDASGSVEAAIATLNKKPVLLLVEDLASVPRLLAGLPGIEVASASVGSSQLNNRIRTFIEGAQKQGMTFAVS